MKMNRYTGLIIITILSVLASLVLTLIGANALVAACWAYPSKPIPHFCRYTWVRKWDKYGWDHVKFTIMYIIHYFNSCPPQVKKCLTWLYHSVSAVCAYLVLTDTRQAQVERPAQPPAEAEPQQIVPTRPRRTTRRRTV